ncbi:hypothetical protein G0Q06_03320 [Puniceicoccales bacterium CK1056]|uniref:TonB C-terminal domain-containing protein n=1 Tax=Oceanipulchritudo coccoides TaxID=2706888 RepID=A0A6B2LZW6_9BACT|nr:hypothetical protein [Oceanipulchritudo coccoides]
MCDELRGAYPKNLKGRGLSDRVRVEYAITPEGRAVNPKVVQIEHQEFMVPAIIHAAKFRFNPPTLKGKPVYAEEFYVIEFSE